QRKPAEPIFPGQGKEAISVKVGLRSADFGVALQSAVSPIWNRQRDGTQACVCRLQNEILRYFMHRFFLPPEECLGNSLDLKGSEAHHALHVLRVRHGDRVTVLNGEGGHFLCAVGKGTRDSVELEVLERVTIPAPACRITLAQALPKGK